MSRILITIFIFVSISYAMIMGYGFIVESSNEFTNLYNKTQNYLDNSEFENAEKCIAQIVKNLDKDRKKLMMITDHDMVETLNTKLDKTSKYIKMNEKSLASAELSEARNIMSIIKGSQELSLENIL